MTNGFGSPASWKSIYRATIGVGEPIIIRRYSGSGTNRPFFDAEVIGRVTNYHADEIVGLIQQGDRKVILIADDLIAKEFQLPITPADKCIVRGKELAVIAPDDSTRRYGGVLIAYELQVRG